MSEDSEIKHQQPRQEPASLGMPAQGSPSQNRGPGFGGAVSLPHLQMSHLAPQDSKVLSAQHESENKPPPCSLFDAPPAAGRLSLSWLGLPHHAGWGQYLWGPTSEGLGSPSWHSHSKQPSPGETQAAATCPGAVSVEKAARQGWLSCDVCAPGGPAASANAEQCSRFLQGPKEAPCATGHP